MPSAVCTLKRTGLSITRRWLLVVFAAVLAFSLSGCFHVTNTIRVKDQNISLNQLIGVDASLISSTISNSDVLDLPPLPPQASFLKDEAELCEFFRSSPDTQAVLDIHDDVVIEEYDNKGVCGLMSSYDFPVDRYSEEELNEVLHRYFGEDISITRDSNDWHFQAQMDNSLIEQTKANLVEEHEPDPADTGISDLQSVEYIFGSGQYQFLVYIPGKTIAGGEGATQGQDGTFDWAFSLNDIPDSISVSTREQSFNPLFLWFIVILTIAIIFVALVAWFMRERHKP